MKLLATQIAIGKGADCENIRDARFDAAAQKIVALAVVAGWDRSSAIAQLIYELREIEADWDFALGQAQRRAAGR